MNDTHVMQEIDEWLRFVERDMKAAEVLLREDLYHTVCFHAQQAVEKAIKAYRLKKGRRTTKIHNLSGLLDKDPDLKEEFSHLMDKIEFLDKFYIPVRYPDAFPGSVPEGLPNEEDATKALEYAEEIVEFVRKRVENAAQ